MFTFLICVAALRRIIVPTSRALCPTNQELPGSPPFGAVSADGRAVPRPEPVGPVGDGSVGGDGNTDVNGNHRSVIGDGGGGSGGSGGAGADAIDQGMMDEDAFVAALLDA